MELEGPAKKSSGKRNNHYALPVLLKEGFWKVSDNVIFGGGNIISFEAFVCSPSVDVDCSCCLISCFVSWS